MPFYTSSPKASGWAKVIPSFREASEAIAPSDELNQLVIDGSDVAQLLTSAEELSNVETPLLVHVALESAPELVSLVTATRDSGNDLVYSGSRTLAALNAGALAFAAAKRKGTTIHFGNFNVDAVRPGADAVGHIFSGKGYDINPFSLHGKLSPNGTAVIGLASRDLISLASSDLLVIALSQYRPLPDLNGVLGGVKTLVTLDALHSDNALKSNHWAHLYVDLLLAGYNVNLVKGGVIGHYGADDSEYVRMVSGPYLLLGSTDSDSSSEKGGSSSPSQSVTSSKTDVSSAPMSISGGNKESLVEENQYLRLLSELFADRLDIVNAPTVVPEHALGFVLADEAARRRFLSVARVVVSDSSLEREDGELFAALCEWISAPSSVVTERLDALLSRSRSPAVAQLQSLASSALERRVKWIIGSQSWAHDLGASGFHQTLASGANVNMLMIDSGEGARRDAGLYAMNYGGAYVASVAVYADFGHTLRALREAASHPGPSIVIAYLPNVTSALDIMHASRVAVETGSWPLYRYNPTTDSLDLESQPVRESLRAFIDRRALLTEFSARVPHFSQELVQKELVEKNLRRKKAQESLAQLTASLEGPPLLILFASDGGKAEKLAKRLNSRAHARGVSSRVAAMDEYASCIEDLSAEPNLVFIVSTAGQGEFPQNGVRLWKALAGLNGILFHDARVGIFGMGDSHYWPRPEDAHFFSKPGKDLAARVQELGAGALLDLGIGDEQDPDTYLTAYKAWEPKLWNALGVEDIEEPAEPEPEPIANEHIKIASNYLRGTIPEGLADKSTGGISDADMQLTKFHGVYRQDNRDIRDKLAAEGKEPAYAFMIRLRLPAGVCTPEQWITLDDISEHLGNSTIKLTTRQTFQLHGIIKSNLKPAIQAINRSLLDTIAAGGDATRTLMCTPNPAIGKIRKQVFETAKVLSDSLVPRTSAYAEIWLDKKLVAGDAVQDVEPLYSKYYLPRKIKITIAVPPYNDVDVFVHDICLIAIRDSNGDLEGFNVALGGGVSFTHSVKTTFPRLSTVIGFIQARDVVEVAKAIIVTHRDNSNRLDRKVARLKYTIDRMGADVFKAMVEKQCGIPFQPARPYKFTTHGDTYGWVKSPDDGLNHFTVYVENGRVANNARNKSRAALREIAMIHKGVFVGTPNQHLIISDVADEDKHAIDAILRKYNLHEANFSGLRLNSSACTAFPTCPVAMAESERYLPVLISKVEALLEEHGLRHDAITMRMSGCPNGCSRPTLGEIAFIGKAPGSYLMLLGGGHTGERLNKIYRDGVGEKEIIDLLRPIIKSYAEEKGADEHFGDFVIRKGIIAPTLQGSKFYENMVPGIAA